MIFDASTSSSLHINTLVHSSLYKEHQQSERVTKVGEGRQWCQNCLHSKAIPVLSRSQKEKSKCSSRKDNALNI